MNFKSPLIALALSAVGMAASAADYTIPGTLPFDPAVFSQSVTVDATGLFTDYFKFEVAPLTGDVSASSSQVNLVPLWIENIHVDLLASDKSTVINIGQDGPGYSYIDAFAGLTVGSTYYFRVSGDATGSAGGSYDFIATATPVPEPSTYALLAAGLGAIGFVARRRKQA